MPHLNRQLVFKLYILRKVYSFWILFRYYINCLNWTLNVGVVPGFDEQAWNLSFIFHEFSNDLKLFRQYSKNDKSLLVHH